jgi:hypothetical protein
VHLDVLEGAGGGLDGRDAHQLAGAPLLVDLAAGVAGIEVAGVLPGQDRGAVPGADTGLGGDVAEGGTEGGRPLVAARYARLDARHGETSRARRGPGQGPKLK